MRGALRRAMCGLLLGITALAGGRAALAQQVTATPMLDLTHFTGTWFVMAQLPTKFQKRCASSDAILYALGDKTNTFQLGNFCRMKNGSPNYENNTGKMDKSDDGKLEVSHLVLFHRKYWVLAIAPDYTWAIVGTPNHKSLWLLSRQQTPASELLPQLEAQAAAQGFSTAKLVTIPQQNAIPPSLNAALDRAPRGQ